MPALNKQELQQQHDLLREEYIKLMNDKDVLLQWGKPQLEAVYAIRIGYLQIEKLQLQLRIRALKRKIEMVQAAINRNEPIDINMVEITVAAELAEAEARIMNEAAKVEQAKFLLSHLDSPERSAELRKLYKQLAKQLHPDVNPELTKEQQHIWHLVKDAYETGDLEKLKALQVVYEKEIKAASEQALEFSEEDLQLKIEVLKEGIKVLNEQLTAIRNEFPFTMEKQIKDEEWVAEQSETVNKELEELKEYEAELTQQYTDLIQQL